VRVIGPTGAMLGVMSVREALRAAQEHNLDLVEVNPKAEPPVCKVMDFGKYKYEEKKKAREAKRKQTFVDIKEIKLRPKTDEHDLDFKMRNARRFCESGNKVKFIVRFRGREIAHPGQAEAQLHWLLSQLEDLVNVDSRPMMEGRTMTTMVTPKPAVMQKVAAAKAALEAARKKAELEGRAAPIDEAAAAAEQAERDEAALEDKEKFDEDEDEDDDKGGS
jgi:translation initiation factor IF-3